MRKKTTFDVRLPAWFASATRTHGVRVCNAPIKLPTLLLFLLTQNLSFAQTQHYTLNDVVTLAREQSIDAKQAATRKNTNAWQYRSFIADFKPQLSLNGTLPGFTRSYIEVRQPDGTISFQPVSNNNSLLNLALTQNIALTGGTIFVQKQL